MSQSAAGRFFSSKQISQFAPAEIRVAIQALVADDRTELAYALGEAGLALYPASEDILVITSLLSVMREDWSHAVDLLTQLMEMQGNQATVFTHAMLIRALRCDLELAAALEASRVALTHFPDHPELLKEYDAVSEVLGLRAVEK
jgi:hypothetical protein